MTQLCAFAHMYMAFAQLIGFFKQAHLDSASRCCDTVETLLLEADIPWPGEDRRRGDPRGTGAERTSKLLPASPASSFPYPLAHGLSISEGWPSAQTKESISGLEQLCYFQP